MGLKEDIEERCVLVSYMRVNHWTSEARAIPLILCDRDHDNLRSRIEQFKSRHRNSFIGDEEWNSIEEREISELLANGKNYPITNPTINPAVMDINVVRETEGAEDYFEISGVGKLILEED